MILKLDLLVRTFRPVLVNFNLNFFTSFRMMVFFIHINVRKTIFIPIFTAGTF